MDLTICGVETPQAPGRSTLLRPELMQLDAWEAAGNQSPQNSQTPLFSAVLFWSKNPGDDAPGAWDFPPKTVLAFLNCLCYNDDS